VNLLLIAPSTALQTTQELLTAMSGMQVESLLSPVTAREVLGQIASDRYDGIHFAGDSSAGVLQLSDGPLAVELLCNALNGLHCLRFVILNSCDSLASAVDIYMHSTTPRVIGWPHKVSDVAAQAWGVTFYRSYRLSQNLMDALHSANEMLARFYPDSEEPRLLNGRLATLSARVDELDVLLKSKHRLFVPTWAVAAVVAIIGLLLCALLLALGIT